MRLLAVLARVTNMNAETQRKLQGVSAKIPKRLVNNLTKTVVDDSEEELARAALNSKDISPRKKAVIRKKLDQGAFRRTEVVENEATIRAIDEHNTRGVAALRASGELPDPNDDPYVRERNHRIANRGAKPAKYSSFLKTLDNARHIQPIGDKILIQEIIEEEKKPVIILLEKENKKAYREGKIFMIGSRVESVQAGQVILFDLYQFEYMEREGERFLIGSEKGVMGIISNE